MRRRQFLTGVAASAALQFTGCADPSRYTDEEAQYLRSSSEQAMLNLRRGMPGQLPPPIRNFHEQLGQTELAMLNDVSRCAAVGTPGAVRARLESFVAATGADELMVVAQIYDHEARLKSYELAATVMAEAA